MKHNVYKRRYGRTSKSEERIRKELEEQVAAGLTDEEREARKAHHAAEAVNKR